MPLFSLEDLNQTVPIVRRLVPETPTYAWPLLEQRLGVKVLVKHENHTPIGAFKARTVIAFLDRYQEANGLPNGVVTATRGNHGQSVAIAASLFGIPSVIVVPEGNAAGKNAAMKAFGGELVVAGADFDESRTIAARIAEEKGYLFVPSFHRDIVMGVATYALELFTAHPDLDVAYVPIGLGSGICGMISVRDLLGLKTEIVGVVAEKAPAYALSFAAGKVVESETANTFADGMAVRVPSPEALDIILAGAARVVEVSEDEIAEAMRILFADTHNVAEGAGAAPLAALIGEKDRYAGKKAGMILSGGNVDESVLLKVLQGETPRV